MLTEPELDLIAALQVAPRASVAVLAEALDVSASTVGRRLLRLEDQRILRVIGQVEWTARARGNPRHVWVTTEPGASGSAAKALARFPEVQLAAETAGRSDVYLAVHVPDRAQARELLADRIPGVAGVAGTHSELVLRALTRADSWRLHRLSQDQHAILAGEQVVPAAPDGFDTDKASPDERRLIGLLAGNGRITAAEAGRILGLSQSTAYRLIQSTLRRGIVRPRVEVEPAQLGYELEAIIALTVTPGAIQDVARELARHPSARYVSIVAGTASIIHQGVFRNEDEMADFLTRDLAPLPGITALQVSVVLRMLRRYWLYREDGRFAPDSLP
ncbi:Lrp/AsnC family transcriptional regulator [Amycolatopsis azurea]|uniref:AsnC-family transcriptional regulator n=1 Tax=Amycolatopsis azurea DSM 43854 TaxID=1238180 RepID=M2Q1B2_9PSEU|nr:Lrp/AsnC family transcriptional regulator [Amycolatopsis azurea]EMD25740.1 AsnC-family transcriptional regulator [Amycolatopsis azurea DSM 43854]OOC02618.1 AsnC family transcriptional regulator [Amycolatopsis azurea DSM 43854]